MEFVELKGYVSFDKNISNPFDTIYWARKEFGLYAVTYIQQITGGETKTIECLTYWGYDPNVTGAGQLPVVLMLPFPHVLIKDQEPEKPQSVEIVEKPVYTGVSENTLLKAIAVAQKPELINDILSI